MFLCVGLASWYVTALLSVAELVSVSCVSTLLLGLDVFVCWLFLFSCVVVLSVCLLCPAFLSFQFCILVFVFYIIIVRVLTFVRVCRICVHPPL